MNFRVIVVAVAFVVVAVVAEVVVVVKVVHPLEKTRFFPQMLK